MKNLFKFIAFLSMLDLGAQSWQTLKELPLALSYPVVVALNGHIHVIGGGATGGATDIHLRYQPALDKWDTLAPVPYKAQQPAGAVVNGKIHFCGGGFPNTGTRLNKHYIYDPDSNKWTAAVNMPVATAIHKAASFDNKLYILTGQPDKQLCEIYDPIAKTWTQKNALPDQNFWYSAIVADKNAIYRFGGGGFAVPQNLAHSYDKLNDAWTPLPNLPLALHGLDGALVNDSLIFLTGGYNQADKNYVWIYNIRSKTYTVNKSLPIARTYHSTVTIDNCIYSVGGNNNTFPYVNITLLKLCPGSSPLQVQTVEKAKPYQLVQTPGYLELELRSGTGSAEIFIADISGKSIYRVNTEDGHVKIESAGFTPGMYMVNIECDGLYYTEKWIVLR
jgi:N-acetylneuraminic acid mutarotase